MSGGSQVYFAAQPLRKFDFHASDSQEAGDMARSKVDQHVDIAIRPEARCQHGTEQRQLSDVVTLTKLRDEWGGQGDRQSRHRWSFCRQYPTPERAS